MLNNDQFTEMLVMMAISFGWARFGSNALRKKIVQEHHENNLEFKRYIKSTYEYE